MINFNNGYDWQRSLIAANQSDDIESDELLSEDDSAPAHTTHNTHNARTTHSAHTSVAPTSALTTAQRPSAITGPGTADDEEEDMYSHFLQTLKADGIDIDEFLEVLGDDDDEDENYEPEEEDEDDEDDDEEEEDDLSLDGRGVSLEQTPVQGKELRDLLSDCLLAVTETQHDAGSQDLSSSSSHNAYTHSSDHFTPHNPFTQSSDDVPSRSFFHPTAGVQHVQQRQPNALINNFVSTLLSSAPDRPTELCIDSLPVNALRRVVARQLSMALQLLLQILLQAENRSDCWTTGYQKLLQLVNLRESAVKKAALMQMNLESLEALRGRERERLRERGAHFDHLIREVRHPEINRTNHPSASQNTAQSTPLTPQTNRRLTRFSLSQSLSQDHSSHSLFALPALADTQRLLQHIDKARAHIAAFSQTTTHGSTQNTSTHNIVGERAAYLSHCDAQLHTLYNALRVPVWKCLSPRGDYPFPSNYSLTHSAQPHSALGRTHFSPAEDDLLLRALVTLSFTHTQTQTHTHTQQSHGYAVTQRHTHVLTQRDWERVRMLYLPTKDAQLLQFRFTQLVNIHKNQQNGFQRYQQLVHRKHTLRRRRREDRWSLPEYFSLLRGFETYGDQWPLTVLHCLPHLRLSEVRHRWMELQRLWRQTFPNITAEEERAMLTPGVRALLLSLHNAHSLAELQEIADYGAILSSTGIEKDTSVMLTSPYTAPESLSMSSPSLSSSSLAYYEHVLEQAAQWDFAEEDELSDSDRERDISTDIHAGRGVVPLSPQVPSPTVVFDPLTAPLLLHPMGRNGVAFPGGSLGTQAQTHGTQARKRRRPL